MRVLVIPEDFRNDQHILKPIVERMLQHIGRPRATVRVCQDPLLGSISQALRWERIAEVLERYQGMTDPFLLCVDRDGDGNRRGRLDHLESQAANLHQTGSFFAEHAWQEIEVWLLAGHDLPSQWVWSDVRQEIDPKERYYLPFAQDRGLLDEPAQGRVTLGREAAHRYLRIRQRCPEVSILETRIMHWLQTRSQEQR